MSKKGRSFKSMTFDEVIELISNEAQKEKKRSRKQRLEDLKIIFLNLKETYEKIYIPNKVLKMQLIWIYVCDKSKFPKNTLDNEYENTNIITNPYWKERILILQNPSTLRIYLDIKASWKAGFFSPQMMHKDRDDNNKGVPQQKSKGEQDICT